MEDKLNDESVEVMQISSDTIYQSDLAAFDSQVTTAKRFPRNLTQIMNNVEVMITSDVAFAEKCIYKLTRDGKDISGPSAALSKLFMQLYGNMRTDSRVIAFEQNFVRAEAVVWDLENNVANKATVLRRITTKKGVVFGDDMKQVTGAAACSIALRNALWAIIPTAFVTRAITLAKNTVLGNVSDDSKFLTRRAEIIRQLNNLLGVTNQEICAYLNVETIEVIDRDHLFTLFGTIAMIEQGDTTVAEVFRPSVEKEVRKPESPVKKDELTLESFIEKVQQKLNPRSSANAAMLMAWITATTGKELKKVFTAFAKENEQYLEEHKCKTLPTFLQKADETKVIEFATKLFNDGTDKAPASEEVK